ncbi:MAG: methionyl-tRNA formyltransferase [Actinobacteria bacterium]|nr:methionyl-tRNA formyltransferase [Actinomycetota bacterium]
MRIVLVGAVESTRVALEALAAHPDATLAALVTLPPDKAVRHADWVDLRPAAAAAGVPVIEAADVNAHDVLDAIALSQPDFLFVIGWSQICRRGLLDLAREGSIGYHPAPLPENRGRAVIPWTILQGRTDTGATLFWMDDGVDSGEILVQHRFPIAADETAQSLYDKHMTVLAAMLEESLPQLGSSPPRIPQDHQRATWCARRRPDDALIDWAQPADAVWTLVRACGDPYPGAFSFHRGRRLVVWECELRGPGPYWGLPGQVQAILGEGALVQCGDGGHVLLATVEIDAGGRCAAAELLGAHDRLGLDLLALVTFDQGRR